MARKEIVELIDDIDGSDATTTVSFAVHGIEYVIDLNEKNAKKLDDALAKYVGHARRVGGRKKTGAAAKSGTTDASAVRAWAKLNGIPVNDRGRIPLDLTAQFLSATA